MDRKAFKHYTQQNMSIHGGMRGIRYGVTPKTKRQPRHFRNLANNTLEEGKQKNPPQPVSPPKVSDNNMAADEGILEETKFDPEARFDGLEKQIAEVGLQIKQKVKRSGNMLTGQMDLFTTEMHTFDLEMETLYMRLDKLSTRTEKFYKRMDKLEEILTKVHKLTAKKLQREQGAEDYFTERLETFFEQIGTFEQGTSSISTITTSLKNIEVKLFDEVVEKGTEGKAGKFENLEESSDEWEELNEED